MFQLTKDEAEIMVSQNAIPSWRSLGGYLPYVFTEQGVAMLSSVLNSERAIQVNILIMRTFAKLRKMIAGHKELAYKVRELERKVGRHDEEINVIIDVIKKMTREPARQKRGIGFHCR